MSRSESKSCNVLMHGYLSYGGYFPTNDVVLACPDKSFAWLAKYSFSFRSLNSLQWKSWTIQFCCLKRRKILGKLKRLALSEVNLISLQCKQDLILHVAKVKVAMSTHSMDDVIPFLAYLLYSSSRTLRY